MRLDSFWLALSLGALAPLGTSHAQVLRQVTDTKAASFSLPSIDGAGSITYVVSTSNEFGDNPGHIPQLFRWDLQTGQGAKLTNLPGIAGEVTVSDDGTWLAFTSTGDMLPEANIDHSTELFVIRTDGSGLAQLTNVPTAARGECYWSKISGSGNRIVFAATANLTAQNPQNNSELFIVDRDGKNLKQLTPGGARRADRIDEFAVSDDGARIAFISQRNYLGTNSDGSTELFVVNADGTGLRQLTSITTSFVHFCDLSGNGAKIFFQSSADHGLPTLFGGANMFVINWDGTGLRRLTDLPFSLWGFNVSATDDGTMVYFQNSMQFPPAINPDGGMELWRVRADGTGLQQLTSTDGRSDLVYSVISGSGSRLVALSYGRSQYASTVGQMQLTRFNPDGSGPFELSNVQGGIVWFADVSRDGSRFAFVSTDNPGGINPSQLRQGWTVRSDGDDLRRLTDLPAGVQSVSISGTGDRIVFDDAYSVANTKQIHTVLVDGTGYRRLTNGGDHSYGPSLSRDGAWVVFESRSSLDGAPHSTGARDVFALRTDGTSLTRLTSDGMTSSSLNMAPRTDATGNWFVYAGNHDPIGSNPDESIEVFRVNRARTVRQQISSGSPGTVSSSPDISGDGRWIAFASTANPLGTNPELNEELFLYDTQTSVLRQLTQYAEGAVRQVRIDESGTYVHFVSTAPVIEFDPYRLADAFRCRISDGRIERLSGVPIGRGSVLAVAPDQFGESTVIVASGVQSGTNLDLGADLFQIDRLRRPDLHINPDSSTIISWQVQPGPIRYDVIRGDVANLSRNPDGTTNLGPVECIDEESIDDLTEKFREQEDPVPWPGRAVFFLNRPNFGLNLGIGTWGTGSNGMDRRPAAGSCAD